MKITPKVENVFAAMIVAALIGGFAFVVDFIDMLPVVERSNRSGEIVRILIDGKEVSRSEYPKILNGRYELKSVK